MTHSTPTLTFETLRSAIAGSSAAFRLRATLQPAGGVGDKVFPPTYEGGKYATEDRVLESGEIVKCVLLDSVQSQANRMELALLDAYRSRLLELPVLTVRFDDARRGSDSRYRAWRRRTALPTRCCATACSTA